jgi:hypothetical protein
MAKDVVDGKMVCHGAWPWTQKGASKAHAAPMPAKHRRNVDRCDPEQLRLVVLVRARLCFMHIAGSSPVRSHLVIDLQSLLHSAVVLCQGMGHHGGLKSGFVDQQGGTSASLDKGRTGARVACSETSSSNGYGSTAACEKGPRTPAGCRPACSTWRTSLE